MNRNDKTLPRAESRLRYTLLRTYPVPAFDTAAAHIQTKGIRL